MKITTRQKIMQAAIETLAADSAATLEEIAEAAGVGRATIYRHFDSRPKLIRELILQAGIRMKTALEPLFGDDVPARDKLYRIVELMIPLGASLHFVVYQPLKDKDEALEQGHLKFTTRLLELCKALQKEGGLASDLPEIWLAACLEKLIFIAWEKIQSGDIAPKQAVDLVLRTFYSGLGGPRP